MALHLTLALTFFNFTGANAARVVLTLYALELGALPAAIGVLGGMFYLFPLLLSLPIGALADRYGPRGLLMIGSICGIGSLLLPYFARSVPAFYVAAALSGLALAFFHVTLQNIMGILSAPHERARNFSNFSLAGAVTNFVGPLIAGFSIDYAGHAAACLYLSALPLTALILLALGGHRLPGGNRSATRGTGTLKSLANRDVVRMLATSSLVQLGTDVFQFYLPIYGHAKGLSASAIGAVLAAFAGASFVVRLYLARLVKHVAPEKLLAWSFYAGALGFMLAPFTNNALTLGIVSFIFGLGMGIGTPLTVMMMFSHSTEGRSGQTLGLRLTANNFVRVVGPILFGAIGSALGLPPVFWINAVLMGAGGLLSRTRAGQSKK
ncbi:MAG TPA: MFS transporter [Burkholderiales bacterium]|nr:MFS transporter [Burkholderiales bacterium]